MKYDLVTISMRGTCSAETQHESLSTYEPLDTFLERHAKDLKPGCLILDLRFLEKLPASQAARLAVAAPMVDFSIKDNGTVKRMANLVGDDPFMRKVVKDFGFNPDRSMPTDGEPGPLDQVSRERLAAWWQVRGGRIGYWTGEGDIVWEPQP